MHEAPLQKLKRLVDSNPLDMLGKKRDVAEKMSNHKKIPKRQVRYLTEAERKEKTKNWPKGTERSMKDQMSHTKENTEHQKRTGRAWND